MLGANLHIRRNHRVRKPRALPDLQLIRIALSHFSRHLVCLFQLQWVSSRFLVLWYEKKTGEVIHFHLNDWRWRIRRRGGRWTWRGRRCATASWTSCCRRTTYSPPSSSFTSCSRTGATTRPSASATSSPTQPSFPRTRSRASAPSEVRSPFLAGFSVWIGCFFS